MLVALFAGLACPHRLLGTSALSSVHVARVELKIRMQPAGKLQLDPKKKPKKTPTWVFFQAQKWPLSGCQGWCWGSNLTPAQRRAGGVPSNHPEQQFRAVPLCLLGRIMSFFFFSMEQWGLKPMARLFRNIPGELPPPGIAVGCPAGSGQAGAPAALMTAHRGN